MDIATATYLDVRPDYEPTLYDVMRLLIGLGGRFESVESRLDNMDARFDKMDKRFDKMDARFDKMDAKFDSMEKRMNDGFLSLVNRTDNINDRLTVVERLLNKVVLKLEDTHDSLDRALSDIHDHSRKHTSHEQKFKKIEKQLAPL